MTPVKALKPKCHNLLSIHEFWTSNRPVRSRAHRPGRAAPLPATGAKYHKADLDTYARSVDFPPQAAAGEIFSGMLPPSIQSLDQRNPPSSFATRC